MITGASDSEPGPGSGGEAARIPSQISAAHGRVLSQQLA